MSYTECVVTTQAELDQALAEAVDWIEIRSPEGVWLELADIGSATVRAYDSATVTATGSATVTAYDSATVTATGSATVTATGSATVTAYGSATVTATGSATVRATGSATVTATGSATVTASRAVAVHLHSGYVKLKGGVVIDHTEKLTDPRDWCEYHGVELVEDAEHGTVAVLYKAVGDSWRGNWGSTISYEPGSTPAAPDWRDTDECGYGLHFSPSAPQAERYYLGATRFLRVGVRLDELRPITDSDVAKCKAKRVVVACVEVDVHHRAVETEASPERAS